MFSWLGGNSLKRFLKFVLKRQIGRYLQASAFSSTPCCTCVYEQIPPVRACFVSCTLVRRGVCTVTDRDRHAKAACQKGSKM